MPTSCLFLCVYQLIVLCAYQLIVLCVYQLIVLCVYQLIFLCVYQLIVQCAYRLIVRCAYQLIVLGAYQLIVLCAYRLIVLCACQLRMQFIRNCFFFSSLYIFEAFFLNCTKFAAQVLDTIILIKNDQSLVSICKKISQKQKLRVSPFSLLINSYVLTHFVCYQVI